MKLHYMAALATASILGAGLAVVFPQTAPAGVQASSQTVAQANPCAGRANPCASANPCAGRVNPCASPNPCASVNPCAGATTTTTSAPLVYSDTNRLAIRGTDPVAYFTAGRPVQGSSQFEYEWNGATWRFSSAQNRALFASNPDAYAPQYGGYCAKAVSEGNLAAIDPNAWRIVDGKLYLNYSAEVQQQWLQDIPGNIAKADANWPEILVGGVVHQ
jgi:YHS domain-containing protein